MAAGILPVLLSATAGCDSAEPGIAYEFRLENADDVVNPVCDPGEEACVEPEPDDPAENGGPDFVCDPLLQNCDDMEMGMVCREVYGMPRCRFDAALYTAPPGTPCEYANSCNAGSFCGESPFGLDCDESVGCCTPFCDTRQTAWHCQQLRPDFECVPWFDAGDAPLGLEHLGGCGVP